MNLRISVPIVLAVGLTLTACDWIAAPAHLVATRAKPGHWEGQVTAINAASTSISMERKTSEGTIFLTTEVRPADELRRLHAGDRIQGKIVVEGQSVYLTEIKIIK